MPLENLLRIHQVEVLKMTVVYGKAMSVTRKYDTVTRILDCRVMPLSAVDREALGRNGYEVSHEIRFLADPLLALGDRVRWTMKNVVMRIVPGIDPHGLGRMYVLSALAMTEDNESQNPIE